MDKKILVLVFSSAFLLSGCSATSLLQTQEQSAQIETKNSLDDITTQTNEDKKGMISEPINNALARITKKPSGLKVSPDHSPINPEKFSGYHTGADFEIFPEEEKTEVNIYSVCAGPLILKKYVSGYGGVAVQQCIINNGDVTVIYGHLKLSSILAELNQELSPGNKIGILGQGSSQETDGERKHLHLGIHKGKTITLLGYVESQDLLSEWIDPAILIK